MIGDDEFHLSYCQSAPSLRYGSLAVHSSSPPRPQKVNSHPSTIRALSLYVTLHRSTIRRDFSVVFAHSWAFDIENKWSRSKSVGSRHSAWRQPAYLQSGEITDSVVQHRLHPLINLSTENFLKVAFGDLTVLISFFLLEMQFTMQPRSSWAHLEIGDAGH